MRAVGWVMVLVLWASVGCWAEEYSYEYRLLATRRISTLEKELNAVAAQGFVYSSLAGGETQHGGHETLVILMKDPSGNTQRQYKVLQLNNMSVLYTRLRLLGAEGYRFCGKTLYTTERGQDGIVVILELDRSLPPVKYTYWVLNTEQTSATERGLNQAGKEGYSLLDTIVSKNVFGRTEVVSVLYRAEPVQRRASR